MSAERLYLLHAGYETNPAFAQNDWKSTEPRRLMHLVCKTLEGSTRVLIVKDWLPWIYVKGVTNSRNEKDVLHKMLRPAGVAEIDYVRRVQAVGFTNERQDAYAKVRVRRWPAWCGDATYKKRIFEHTVKPHSKFYCESGLRSGAWFDCAAAGDEVLLSHLTPQLQDATPPKLTIMAYDLETSGLDPNKCRIYQCCCVFWTSDQQLAPDTRSVVLCTQPTDTVRNTNVRVLPSERSLLLALASLIRLHDVDVLTGFNLSFDNGFIRRRLAEYQGMQDYDLLGRPEQAKSIFVVKQLKTAAMGNNELVLWSLPGRVVIDLFLFAKANHPTLPNYRLDTCGQRFVGIGKDDVPFGTILKSFADEAAVALRGDVAAYCLQDGYLCLQLMDVWCAHISCTEEAAACAMNVGAVPDSGRQIKVLSLLLSEIHNRYVFNPPKGASEEEEEEEDQGYEGAFVLDTQKGFYSGPLDQVILLDFASLYPSLLKAHRISPDRYVRKDVPEEVAASQEPGVVVVEHQVSAEHSVLLATPFPDPGKPYFYNILQKLLDERAAVRKQLKIEPDPAKKAILNARQLAKKVGANSAYGLLGCRKGYMPLPDLAAVTTYQGRQALMFSKDMAERKYGAVAVAGDTDSIMILLPAEPGVPTPAEPDQTWLRRRMHYVFKQGALIGDDISSQLPAELIFELEGCLFPAAFYKRKCYSAVIYEQPDKPKPELKMRGVCAVRNDWSILTKEASTKVLRMGIQENNMEGAVAYLRDLLAKMRDGQLPIEMYVISKQLKSLTPKVVSPHVALCQRLLKERPEHVPVLGAKVEFVIVKGYDNLSEASRLPQDATIADLDLVYYFEKQILKPLTELLGILVGGGPAKLKKLLLKDADQHKQKTMYECFGANEPVEVIERPVIGEPAPITAAAPRQKDQTMYSALNVQQPAKRKAEAQQTAKKVKKTAKKQPASVLSFFAKK